MSWTFIESVSLSSSQASVTLGSGGSLPQTYKTLKVVMSPRTDRSTEGDGVVVKFNNSASSYTGRRLYGNGSTASSDTAVEGIVINSNGATASTFGNAELTIPNYSGSTNKAATSDSVSENNATLSFQFMSALLWSNTAAITSIVFSPQLGTNFVSGSSFTLYGLR